MKKAQRLLMITLALAFALASTSIFANVSNDKGIEKARTAAKNAAQDDWKTLNKSAKFLIKKNIHMDEALAWLEKSISIKKNTENLELLGDYYVKIGNNRQAMISYIEVIKFGKAKNANFYTLDLEQKIANVR